MKFWQWIKSWFKKDLRPVLVLFKEPERVTEPPPMQHAPPTVTDNEIENALRLSRKQRKKIAQSRKGKR
jgi:hypothetical protein